MNGQHATRFWPQLLFIWASLLVYGAVAAPTPGVNEPHYLCKAKHYWQPDWCATDFFLASPNAHTVFYITVGSLTQWFSFEQSAWVGRSLAMLVLAWGWTRCFSCIFLTPWSVLWSAWIYLALAACGNFSGEWLVGGVEGKVFCYGLLLAALADVYHDRWLPAAALTGAAVSFHPVVGLWSLLAFGGQIATETVIRRWQARRMHKTTASAVAPLSTITPTTLILCVLLLVGLSLPGMIPVIQLLRESVSPETRYEGTYIQVYFRLAHHLDPMMFPARAYCGYAVLILFWLCSFCWGGRTKSQSIFDMIVAWSVIFALAGIIVGLGPRPASHMPYFAERMNLLKFYPFRLGDLLVLIATSVSLVCVLERSLLNAPSKVMWPVALMFMVYLASLGRASSITETNRYSRDDRADWLDICHWIDQNLPADAMVQSPTNGWAFKWFARRAEYVAFKDCPQDAAGIVEWNRRLNFLQHWYETRYDDQFYSKAELRDLQKQTGITHLLVDRLGPMDLEPIYQNGTFKVYDLRPLVESN